MQNIWRRGLESYRGAIAGKSERDVDAFLEKLAQNEFAPNNGNEIFFVILKAVVTERFYTSEVGIEQELGHKGMTFLLDF